MSDTEEQPAAEVPVEDVEEVVPVPEAVEFETAPEERADQDETAEQEEETVEQETSPAAEEEIAGVEAPEDHQAEGPATEPSSSLSKVSVEGGGKHSMASQEAVIDILNTPTFSVPSLSSSVPVKQTHRAAPALQPPAEHHPKASKDVPPPPKVVEKRRGSGVAGLGSANHSTGSRGGSASGGRDAIRRSVDMVKDGKGGMATGTTFNAALATPLEEYTRFRRHYKVAPSYRGPIYVAEDIMVPCVACGGPLDPIQRVPVGKLFFHRYCVECFLCGLKSLTEPYFQVGDRAVCSNCAERGNARCVPKEEAKSRRMVLGAIRGNAYDAFRHADLRRRERMSGTVLNRPTIPGVSAPSLSVGLLHNRRNTTRRTFELVQRQQHYTQNDCNILFTPIEDTPEPVKPTKRVTEKKELPRLK